MGRWNCWRLAVRNELSNEGQSLKATAYITIGKTHSGKKKGGGGGALSCTGQLTDKNLNVAWDTHRHS